MLLEHPVSADSEEASKIPGVTSRDLMSQLKSLRQPQGTVEPL